MTVSRGHMIRNIIGVLALTVILFTVCHSSYAAPMTKIDGETIKGIIVSHIEKNMPWPKGSVRIEFEAGISGVTLPGNEITCRVVNNRKEDYIGYSMFTVRFYNKGVFVKKQAARVKMEVLKGVVVSSKFLSKDTRIEPDDIMLVNKWFNRIPSNVITNIDDVIGRTLRTNVKLNTEITRSMLQNTPVVKKGELVRIVLQKGPLKISTVGLSKQNGETGDLIRITNISSKKIIYARVVGDSIVSVEY
ncbi:MAG: flagellar basal body P-ring formation protein FlgA [Deltaproteobacteria bacterium]|nr:flagellar basal body P-ring formation protein FlgA [Deltaproteobacteria bacterium]